MTNKRIVYSTDNENFNIDCEGEAIDTLISESFEPLTVGQSLFYYVADAREFVPSDFVTDYRVEDLIENMNCSACDEAGEYAEDFGYCTKEDREELKGLIGAWADKHLTCSFWGVDNVREVELVITQEMLD